ncbi:MAG: TraR/DksA family transcriptional regulator [Candidatus Omnitrophota bacterium]|nr:TraR/DksA family transcriptional regulator [Candidatus Omnitrophota bacterium]
MKKKRISAKSRNLAKKTLKEKKMPSKELKIFKKILLKYKEDIADQIKHISDNTLKKSQRDAAGDISSYTLHMADMATDTYDREFSLDLASNERKLLYEIDDALKRIDEKNFGICEKCSKSINKPRLKALPYTRMCLDCQRGLENIK